LFSGTQTQTTVDSAEPLPTSEEIKLEQFKGWLKKHQRNIKLPQLLIEVDNELHFTRHFLPLVQSKARPVDEICAIIAAVMANGCNIGPDTMAKLTPGVAYQQIKKVKAKPTLLDIRLAIDTRDTAKCSCCCCQRDCKPFNHPKLGRIRNATGGANFH